MERSRSTDLLASLSLSPLGLPVSFCLSASRLFRRGLLFYFSSSLFSSEGASWPNDISIYVVMHHSEFLLEDCIFGTTNSVYMMASFPPSLETTSDYGLLSSPPLPSWIAPCSPDRLTSDRVADAAF